MIKHVLGWILLFEALFLVPPTLISVFCREKSMRGLLISILICAAVGFLCVLGKAKNKTLYSREGFVIVSLSWVILSIFGAIPFFIYFRDAGLPYSFIDAFFETVSGFTTTGASILLNVESMPYSLLFWRSFTNWIGGMGVLVFVMAFIPLSGANNLYIMKAESPGPSVSKLVPRVRTTALILYSMYFVLTLIQFILLICGGMSPFEAICASFSTAGTGGFGVKNDSFASYSTYIQIVTGIFMLLFSLNFASYYLALKGKFKEAFNSEIRWFIIIVFTAVTAITINTFSLFDSVSEAIKHVFFTVSSIISTTGFASTDFALWPEFSRGIIILLMVIGACAGSTGGGIKVSRIIIFFKSLGRELRYMLHPKQIKKVTVDKRPVENETVRTVAVYLICYVILFIVSYLIISLDPSKLCNFETGFSAVMATINNIGPGLSNVGPSSNFSWLSATSKLVLSFDMLAGRLELFPMLLLFHPKTWKKN